MKRRSSGIPSLVREENRNARDIATQAVLTGWHRRRV
jgi:hypothetical protein